MSATKTSICNGALLLLGQEPSHVDVDTDTSVYAGDLKAAWDVAVDAAIRSHPWNFAMHYASIGNDADTPTHGFDKRYTRPSDPWCLRVWKFSTEEHGVNPRYKVVGRYIYTDEGSPIKTVHIVRVTDTGLFDPSFVTLLEMILAAKVGFKITGAMSVAEAMEERISKFRPQATAIDSQETGEEDDDEGEFLGSRW